MDEGHGARPERKDGGRRRSAWDFATSGTYVDQALRAPSHVAFLVIAFAVALIPFVGMLWAPTNSTTENRELAQAPSLQADDAGVNLDALADAGAYFEDHLAYRNELVSANAGIRQPLLASPTDQVVIGRDGWLYYGGTLPDYLGQSALTERGLNNVAHNIGLMKRYVESHGARFAFAIAPNKNTLYPERMPYYYLRSPAASNAERLKDRLVAEQVDYLDLFELFGASSEQARLSGSESGGNGESPASKSGLGIGETWYLKRDTHWTNKGALVAAHALADTLGMAFLGPDPQEGAKREDFTGDLESMLHPANSRVEDNWYYEGYDDGEGFSGTAWTYEEGGSVTDSEIVTKSNDRCAEGSLLMFRDSFGNALVPFLAATFEHATFSKLVPYNVALLAGGDADVVVVERAERHLTDLASSAPLMPSPVIAAKSLPDLPGKPDPLGAQTALAAAKNGPYAVLSGVVDPRLANDESRIIVEFEGADATSKLYDAFWLSSDDARDGSGDFGFQVNMPIGKVELAEALAGAHVRVYVLSGGEAMLAAEFSGDSLAEI